MDDSRDLWCFPFLLGAIWEVKVVHSRADRVEKGSGSDLRLFLRHTSVVDDFSAINLLRGWSPQRVQLS